MALVGVNMVLVGVNKAPVGVNKAPVSVNMAPVGESMAPVGVNMAEGGRCRWEDGASGPAGRGLPCNHPMHHPHPALYTECTKEDIIILLSFLHYWNASLSRPSAPMHHFKHRPIPGSPLADTSYHFIQAPPTISPEKSTPGPDTLGSQTSRYTWLPPWIQPPAFVSEASYTVGVYDCI